MAVLVTSPNPVNVGIDVGQVQDPMTVCVTEVYQRDTGKHRYTARPSLGGYNERGDWVPTSGIETVMVTEYAVRYISRLPLGTSYPDAAIIIADLLCSSLLTGRKVRVLIDSTGVGKPVYEDLVKEFSLRKYGFYRQDGTFQEGKQIPETQIKPINFVHGEKYNSKTGILGKSFLVSRLQSLLQSLRVHAPNTPEVLAMLEELKIYERRMSQDGKDQYGAFKAGTHDDLATSLGLSVLEDVFAEKVRYSGRVY